MIVVDALQLRLVGRLTASLAGVMVLLVALAALPPALCGFMGCFSEWGLMESRYRLETILTLIALPLLGGLVFFFALALQEAFRIAGPCYRFRRVFQGIRDLRIPSVVKLREGDYLHELAADLSAGLCQLNAQLKEHRRLTRKIHLSLGQSTTCQADSQELSELVEALHHSLEQFDLGPQDEPDDGETTPIGPPSMREKAAS
jgi:hypothetical protein